MLKSKVLLMDFTRKITQEVHVGDLTIGGGKPVVVQSMNNIPLRDVAGNIAQIERLAAAGCHLTRLAVPSPKEIPFLKEIIAGAVLPVVADIHFSADLAVMAMEAGADKIRLNPGNIRDKDKLRRAVIYARDHQIPIRVGVNSGSLSPEILRRFGGPTAEALWTQGIEAIRELESYGHDNLVLSLKSSDPMLMIQANREASRLLDYPLHLGVTEAGTERGGVLKSAVGIGTLLAEGIGDTIRISLQAEPETEIAYCYELLKAVGLASRGAELIVCPGCGRTEVDLRNLALRVEDAVADIRTPLKIALMGCVVNGPGEAREADIGLAGGRQQYVLFEKGEVKEKVQEDEAFDVLMRRVAELVKEAEAANDA